MKPLPLWKTPSYFSAKSLPSCEPRKTLVTIANDTSLSDMFVSSKKKTRSLSFSIICLSTIVGHTCGACQWSFSWSLENCWIKNTCLASIPKKDQKEICPHQSCADRLRDGILWCYWSKGFLKTQEPQRIAPGAPGKRAEQEDPGKEECQIWRLHLLVPKRSLESWQTLFQLNKTFQPNQLKSHPLKPMKTN